MASRARRPSSLLDRSLTEREAFEYDLAVMRARDEFADWRLRVAFSDIHEDNFGIARVMLLLRQIYMEA